MLFGFRALSGSSCKTEDGEILLAVGLSYPAHPWTHGKDLKR